MKKVHFVLKCARLLGIYSRKLTVWPKRTFTSLAAQRPLIICLLNEADVFDTDLRSMAGRGEYSTPADLSSIERGDAPLQCESWTGVGTLHQVGTIQRFRLMTFLAESQDPEQGRNRERDEQRQADPALQLRSSKLSRERDQVRTDLSILQQQVASLMAERNHE
uniref:Uncharacterized protein n=1 Tax=Sphaerodactylus townsendi TaxID=933632 RepID=A0ACB8GG36_9SAUR